MRGIKLKTLGASAQAQIKTQPAGFKQGRIKRAAKEDRTYNGTVFDSKAEMKGFLFLLPLIKPGCLHLQPKFELQPKFRDVSGKVRQPICYSGDYWLYPKPRTSATDPVPSGAVIIDNKGMLTDKFILKEKLFSFIFKVKLHLPKTKKDWEKLMLHPDLQPYLIK